MFQPCLYEFLTNCSYKVSETKWDHTQKGPKKEAASFVNNLNEVFIKEPLIFLFQFFAKHIVDTSEDNVNEWLATRKLVLNNSQNVNNDNVETSSKWLL